MPALSGTSLAGVSTVPSRLVTPVGGPIAAMTSSLGISLGQADVRVTGIRCDGAVLVDRRAAPVRR